MLLQQRRQPRFSTRGGLAADTSVDKRQVVFFLAQLLLQKVNPSTIARQAVLGGEAVAEHEQGF